VTLILTSDRGLCGPYNGSVLRSAMAELRTRQSPGRKVELVGKKGVSFLKFNGVPVARHHTQFGDKPEFEEVQRLAQEYIDQFIAGRITGVRVIYMRYVSVGRQTPETLQLLPLKPPAIARRPAA
jgi:F-type H+-transporting ATPase subunit gamma